MQLVLIIASVCVLLLILAFAAANLGPFVTMDPAPSGLVEKTGTLRIWAVKNNINDLFVVDSGEELVAVDSGTKPEKVKAEFMACGLDPLKVKAVFLTHSDYDHVGGLGLFPNAAFYFSEDELQMIDGRKKRNFYMINKLPAGVFVNRFNLLGDNQTLKIGSLSVRCIKTPGHTRGSMSYLFDDKFLFTGDALRINKGVFRIPPFTMDRKQGKNSLAIIDGVRKQADMVFTAHYGCHKAGDLRV